MNSPLFFMLGCIWMPMAAQETSLESFNEKTTDEAHNLLSSFNVLLEICCRILKWTLVTENL